MRAFVSLLLFAGGAVAAPPLTVVQDTLYKADGTLFNGIAHIEWKSFQAFDGSTIPQNAIQVRIASGNLNVGLVPTTNADRPVQYTVRYNTDGRTQYSELWSVPQSVAPVRLVDVRSAPLGSVPPGNLTSIPISDVSGLRTELDLRPIRGATWVGSRTAVIGASGGLESALGEPDSCVHVDGTAGPCGVGGLTYVDGETPLGTVDGVNTVFLVGKSPAPAGSLLLYRNGLLQQSGTEYTLSGRTVTFAPGHAPQPGDTISAYYRVSPDSTYSFVDAETPVGAVDGSNAIFTLSAIPLPASSLMVFRNGLLQKPVIDYALSLDRITFVQGALPQTGDLLQVWYRKRSKAALPGRSLRTHLRARPADNLEILPGPVFEHVVPAFLDCRRVDQFAPDRDRARTGLEKVGRRVKVHTTGRDHLDLRERSFQRLDVLGAADSAGGKHFHDVRSRLPCGQHFGGRQSAGHDWF
jgi:hypothetical protein